MHRHNTNNPSFRSTSFVPRRDIDARRGTSFDKVSFDSKLTFIHDAESNKTVPRKISDKHDKVFVSGCLEPQVNAPRANGVFVVLARNKELEGVLQSVRSIERHFNRWFHYPYVFLNDGDFNSTFKETVLNYTSGTVEWGKIDDTMWGYPEWVDEKVAKEGIAKQGDAAIMYGGMESYHHMCRFYSGCVRQDKFP